MTDIMLVIIVFIMHLRLRLDLRYLESVHGMQMVELLNFVEVLRDLEHHTAIRINSQMLRIGQQAMVEIDLFLIHLKLVQ